MSLSLPDEFIWPVIFAMFAVMGALGTGVAYRKVPESRPPVRQRPLNGLLVSPQLLRLMVIVFTTGAAETMIAPIYLIYLQDKFTTDIVTLAWAYLPAGGREGLAWCPPLQGAPWPVV